MSWTAADRAAYERKLRKIARQAHSLNDSVADKIIAAAQKARLEVHRRLLDIAEGRRTGRLTPLQVDKLRREVEEIMDVFEHDALKLFRDSMKSAQATGGAAIQTLADAINYNLGATPFITPEMVAFAEQYAGDLITGLSAETLSSIETELSRALLTGSSPYDTMKAVDDAMGVGRDTGVSAKAEAIVRTEIGRTHNLTGFEGTKTLADNLAPDERALLRKVWRSAKHPGRTREGHWEADDTYSANPIPYDEPFLVRIDDRHPYEELMYPGDPNGSAGNVINCLCTWDIDPTSIDDIIAAREIHEP